MPCSLGGGEGETPREDKMDPDIKEDNDSTDHIREGLLSDGKDNEVFGSSVLLVEEDLRGQEEMWN